MVHICSGCRACSVGANIVAPNRTRAHARRLGLCQARSANRILDKRHNRLRLACRLCSVDCMGPILAGLDSKLTFCQKYFLSDPLKSRISCLFAYYSPKSAGVPHAGPPAHPRGRASNARDQNRQPPACPTVLRTPSPQFFGEQLSCQSTANPLRPHAFRLWPA